MGTDIDVDVEQESKGDAKTTKQDAVASNGNRKQDTTEQKEPAVMPSGKQEDESNKVEEKKEPVVTSPGKGHEHWHEVQTDESNKVEEKQKPIVTSPSKEAETSDKQDEEKLKAIDDGKTNK